MTPFTNSATYVLPCPAAAQDHDARRNALLWAGLNLSRQNLRICTRCDALIAAGVCTGCTEEGS
jgi:hypothetical protein